MKFREGDSVMHRTHGLGKVVRLEERSLSEQSILYYSVQIADMTVWVPADEMLETRLRLPTRASEFKKLMSTLSEPGEPLPVDRRERKTMLSEWVEDGRTESLIRVIRSLSTYRLGHSLNIDEQAFMKRARGALLGEWSFSMSIPLAQAETELSHLLTPEATVAE